MAAHMLRLPLLLVLFGGASSLTVLKTEQIPEDIAPILPTLSPELDMAQGEVDPDLIDASVQTEYWNQLLLSDWREFLPSTTGVKKGDKAVSTDQPANWHPPMDPHSFGGEKVSDAYADIANKVPVSKTQGILDAYVVSIYCKAHPTLDGCTKLSMAPFDECLKQGGRMGGPHATGACKVVADNPEQLSKTLQDKAKIARMTRALRSHSKVRAAARTNGILKGEKNSFDTESILANDFYRTKDAATMEAMKILDRQSERVRIRNNLASQPTRSRGDFPVFSEPHYQAEAMAKMERLMIDKYGASPTHADILRVTHEMSKRNTGTVRDHPELKSA